VAFDCTAAAALPSIVATGDLVRANARLETAALTGQEMVGQAIGGAAFSAARAIPFFADAVGFVAAAAVLPGAVPDNAPAAGGTRFFADLREGAKVFLDTPLMRVMAGLVTLLAFCQTMVLGILVLFATRDLHLTKPAYGLLLGLAAVGNLVGAASAHWLHVRIGSGWSLVTAGVLSALAYPVLSVTASPALACAALAVEAGAVFVGIVAAQSLRQATIPLEFQGRVTSAWMTLILSASPLGGLAGGLLGAWIGIRHTFLAAGILQLVVVLAATPRLLQHTRRPAGPAGSFERHGLSP